MVLLKDVHYFCRIQQTIPSCRLNGKESPGNTERHTPERGDIREGIVLQQKMTVPKLRNKGEKVG